MRPVKAIIIEDNIEHLNTLVRYLKGYEDQITLVGVATNIAEAKDILRKNTPDILFLDVVLNKEISLVELKGYWPSITQIIVTSNFGDYAITAIEVNVAAYLLKPIDPDLLRNTLDQVLKNLEKHHLEKLDQVVVKSANSWHVIKIETIVRAEATSGYTNIHLNDRKAILVSKSIGDIAFLNNEDIGFIRIHKSHVINLKYVFEVKQGKQAVVVMTDMSEVPLAQRRRDKFFQLLERWPTI